jgi:hypothetical protein
MFPILITADKLDRLRKLSESQLRERGFDPDSVTAACVSPEGEAALAEVVRAKMVAARRWRGGSPRDDGRDEARQLGFTALD